jgi:hypothetical protein
MPGHAGERAVENLVLHALIGHAAAAGMLDGDDAVHIREIAKGIHIEPFGNELRHGCGAVYGRDDGDVVPRA